MRTVLLSALFLAALAAGAAAPGDEAPAPFPCPEGAVLQGSAPPEGRVLACEKRGPKGTTLRHGRAVEWSEQGVKRMEGEYRDGAMHGRFTFWTDAGRRIADVHFRNDLPLWAPAPECPSDTIARTFPVWAGGQTPVGRSLWFQVACVSREGRGVRHGPFTEWYPNRNKRAVGSYREGKQEGPTTVWYENGQISMTGTYVDGKTSGLWTWWHEDGDKRLEGHYVDGVRDGRWTRFRPAGREAETGVYRLGKKTGLWTRYRKDGSKLEEAQYVDDEVNGKRNTWYANGMIQEIEEYVAGERQRTLLRVLPNGRAVPLTQEDCLRQQGEWARFGLLDRFDCNLPASDAGRPCQDGLDCEGACIAPPRARGATLGYCSEHTIVRGSCLNFVRAGVPSGVTCVD